SIREVPLPEAVATIGAAHLAANPVHDEMAPLFRSRVGKPVWPTTFSSSVWRPLLQRLDRPRATRFHDIRHFYASLLIAAGESVLTGQHNLGHSSAKETLDVYGHLWPDSHDRSRSAVDTHLGLLMNGVGGLRPDAPAVTDRRPHLPQRAVTDLFG